MFDILLSFVSKRTETREFNWDNLGRDVFIDFIGKFKQYIIKQ